jgi:hypothetical protein
VCDGDVSLESIVQRSSFPKLFDNHCGSGTQLKDAKVNFVIDEIVDGVLDRAGLDLPLNGDGQKVTARKE